MSLTDGQYDAVATQQLREEPFGPWPRPRSLLRDAGFDPNSVEVRSLERGHPDPAGELLAFVAGDRGRFTARLKWYAPSDGAIVDWKREPVA